jgi:hypothetical protein
MKTRALLSTVLLAILVTSLSVPLVAAQDPVTDEAVPQIQDANIVAFAGEEANMYVRKIRLTSTPITGGNRIKAEVTILDETDSPVPGADVSVEWTYPDNNSFSRVAATDTAGKAYFFVNTQQTGRHRMCVTDVQAAGYVYDPGMNHATCDWISIGEPKMYVRKIRLTSTPITGGNRIKAEVTILDETGSPVPGAGVSVEWTYPDRNSFSRVAATDAAGKAYFFVNTRQTGKHKMCVTRVQAAGYVYDPGMNHGSCDWIDIGVP